MEQDIARLKIVQIKVKGYEHQSNIVPEKYTYKAKGLITRRGGEDKQEHNVYIEADIKTDTQLTWNEMQNIIIQPQSEEKEHKEQTKSKTSKQKSTKQHKSK